MRKSTFVTMLVLILASPVFSQRATVGLRDRIGLGLSLGAPTALVGDIQFARWNSSALAVQGYYGATVSSWGIGEGYGVGLRCDALATNDGVDDVLLVSPECDLNTLVGQPTNRGWVNFAPYSTVRFVAVDFGVGWVHEYGRWSVRLSATPGIALGLEGLDGDREAAKGSVSLLLRLDVRAQFPGL